MSPLLTGCACIMPYPTGTAPGLSKKCLWKNYRKLISLPPLISPSPPPPPPPPHHLCVVIDRHKIPAEIRNRRH